MDIGQLLVQHGPAIGYALFFFIIFAESGLLVGFFLPGDSLLFTVGLLLSQGHFNPVILTALGCLAAVTGDSVGYLFGKKVGPSLFSRPNSLLFKKENVAKAQEFYDKYGKKTIVLARFTPVVRTFAPILAGVAEMEYRTFVAFNVIGGVSWVALVIFAGYFLGNAIPNIDRYILPVVGAIVVLSLIPIYRELSKKK